MFYQKIIRPLFFQFDPETAHEIVAFAGRLSSSQKWMLPLIAAIFRHGQQKINPINLCGIQFPNRVGLGAGFDKNAQFIPFIRALGFGFTEIGSVTNLPGKGNPKPRITRLPPEHAIINRMGLNNDGAKVIAKRIEEFRAKNTSLAFPIGINIAKTHSPDILGDDGIRDMLASFQLLAPLADYVTLNVSCPNTREGKTFEDPELLKKLLESILPYKNKTPIFVKLSPDLSISALDQVLQICADTKMDGLVIGNTSAIPGKGGLSGRPIQDLSTKLISHVTKQTSQFAIIGCGGIDSLESAKAKIDAGASLIQIYTGMIYEGPFLASSLATKL